MEQVRFDFNHLIDMQDFYCQFAKKFSLGNDFGENLDALWDVVTGEIILPVEVVFMNLNPMQKRRFAALILLFEEAEEELDGDLHFTLQEQT